MASPMTLASLSDRRRIEARNAHWSCHGSIVAGSEDGRAGLAALSLQRKGYQVPETSLGNKILGWEQAVIAAEIDLGPYRHRLAQQSCT